MYLCYMLQYQGVAEDYNEPEEDGEKYNFFYFYFRLSCFNLFIFCACTVGSRDFLKVVLLDKLVFLWD